MSDQAPYQIDVLPVPHYLAEQSDPAAGRYVFAYTITLHNRGQRAATLISRHWIITDGNQQVQEVRGLGVVGEQPRLEPGDSYRYTSGSSFETPLGTMRGSYQMLGDDGERFEIEIPEFVLAIPGKLH
jgi:ApaG protein